MRRILLNVVLGLLCLCLFGCGVSAEDKNAIESEIAENTVSAEITGRCITGRDGKIIISGTGDNQQVYVITDDKSEDKLFNRLEFGDEVALSCDVLTSRFPMNLTIKGGSVTPCDKEICINYSLMNTLRDAEMVEESLMENQRVIMTSDITGVCAVSEGKVILLSGDTIILNGDCLSEIKNGDMVIVTLGEIMETWPSSATAYYCKITEHDCMDSISDELINQLNESGYKIQK